MSQSQVPDVHFQLSWMTSGSPANTRLSIPTSLQICKYVDLEGCPLLVRPCSTFGEKQDSGEGRKTAPGLHIRSCFGLQHQLLIIFYTAELLHNSGNANRNPNSQHLLLYTHISNGTLRCGAKTKMETLETNSLFFHYHATGRGGK